MTDLRKEYLATARRLIEIGQQLGGTPQAMANDIILLSTPPHNFEKFKIKTRNGKDNQQAEGDGHRPESHL